MSKEVGELLKTYGMLPLERKVKEILVKRIQGIFDRFLMLYGAEFSRLWHGVDIQQLGETWDKALIPYPIEAIKMALKRLELVPRCPNLPQFITIVSDEAKIVHQEHAENLRQARSRKKRNFSPEEIQANKIKIAEILSTIGK